jgi:ferric-dicitrate binding protein FerR (iron transport regulator)
MNDCRSFKDLLEEYMDGMIREDRLEEFKAHAATCETCGREFRRITLMQAMIADAFEPRMDAKEAAAAVVANLSSRADHRPQYARVAGVWTIRARMAIAAAILLTTGLIAGFTLGRAHPVPPIETAALAEVPMKVADVQGMVLVRHDGSNSWQSLESGDIVYRGDTFHSVAKAEFVLDLGNNSTIKVNPNSMLALVSYGDKTEFSLEQGECTASLESPHGPFFVRTPHGRVEALGTEFTVTVE